MSNSVCAAMLREITNIGLIVPSAVEIQATQWKTAHHPPKHRHTQTN